MQTIHGRGLGWHRDLPDMRDHTLSTATVSKVLAKSWFIREVRTFGFNRQGHNWFHAAP